MLIAVDMDDRITKALRFIAMLKDVYPKSSNKDEKIFSMSLL